MTHAQHLQPLIKWPGGKRALLNELLPLVPTDEGRYYEPFLGGGALFFALKRRGAVLSDSSSELINLYSQVRDHPSKLIARLQRLKNSETSYYAVRASRPTSPLGRAARLLYLVTLSFNGIHRVNLAGDFNVPYGHKKHLSPCDHDRILKISEALSTAKLRVADFQSATRHAPKGSTIYFDPPYTVAHGQNGFLKYNENIFSWADQVRLADHARDLTKRGCTVLVSNADHPSLLKLYKGFKPIRVERFSRIAASKEHRRSITEMIFLGGK